MRDAAHLFILEILAESLFIIKYKLHRHTHTDRMKKCTIFSHFTPIILHKRIQVYFQLDDVMFRARLMEFSSDNL